jgi:hypothetical protein
MVYNFTTLDTVEQRVLDVLYERVEKFRETIGDLEPILGELERDVKKVIMAQHADLDEEISSLEKSIDKKLKDAEFIQKKIQDFVMDTRQFNFETVNQILGKQPVIGSDDLKQFVKAALHNLGGSSRFEEDGKICSVQLPFGYKRSKCSQTKYSGTFDQAFARENENTEFIAFGHELITELLTHFSTTDEPICTIIHEPKIRPGSLFVYIVEIESLKTRQVFFPVFIDETSTYDQKEGEKCLIVLKNLLSKRNLTGPAGPVDIDKQYRAAETVVGDYIASESAKTEKLREDLIIRERARIERLDKFRMSKLNDEHQKEKILYEKWFRSADKQQKRILPAIEGRIKAIEGRMEEQKAETKSQIERLKSRSELKVSYDLFGVARFTQVVHQFPISLPQNQHNPLL